MINPIYRAYDSVKQVLKVSGCRLYRNKLFLFNKTYSTACKLKKSTIIDTFNGKVLKQKVKVM